MNEATMTGAIVIGAIYGLVWVIALTFLTLVNFYDYDRETKTLTLNPKRTACLILFYTLLGSGICALIVWAQVASR